MTRKLAIMIMSFIVILNILSLKGIATDVYKAKTYIDNPAKIQQPIVKEMLTVKGWYMTNDEQAQLKIYIDDEEQQITELKRENRQDVINAIKGYGNAQNNPQPGYVAKVDVSNIKSGIHKLKTDIVSRTGDVLTTDVRTINIQNYTGTTYVDSPANGKENIVWETLTVNGWLMSDDIDAQIKIFIDGQEQQILETQRFKRPDVINAVNGYGGINKNPTPGYSAKIDISNIKQGNHELTVKIISRANDILATNTRKIKVQQYIATSYLEKPKLNETVNPLLTIGGWLMSTDEEANINIYVDGKKQEIQNITRFKRQDVIDAIKGYGGSEENPTPGYEATVNIGVIPEGTHLLKVEVVSKDGTIIHHVERNINIKKYKAKNYIENPLGNEIKKIEKTLTIDGWLMADDINSKIKVYVDGTEIPYEIKRFNRQDVINAIKGYGGSEENPTPGYSIKIDLSNFKDGIHQVKMDIISITGEILDSKTKKVELNKYKAKSYLETPKINGQAKTTLLVAGWIMSTDTDSSIKIYIDNQKQNIKELIRLKRQDVIDAIDGYGGKKLNPTPGYEAKIDVSKFQDGKHTLRIDIMSREGKVLHTQSRTIVIYNNYDFGIDVSYHNGIIDWSKVKQHGVDFAIIRAGFRGYGAEGNLKEDPQFVNNMKGAIANGIDVGVYFYSQAITEAEAIEEAEMTIKLIEQNGFSSKILLPVVIDTEESGGRGDQMSNEQRTKVVKAFCDRIAQSGYTPMIYSNTYWLDYKLNMSELSRYEVWVARYTGTDDPINNPLNYKGNYQIWQYTEKGSVHGINGNVDLNISYKKYVK